MAFIYKDKMTHIELNKKIQETHFVLVYYHTMDLNLKSPWNLHKSKHCTIHVHWNLMENPFASNWIQKVMLTNHCNHGKWNSWIFKKKKITLFIVLFYLQIFKKEHIVFALWKCDANQYKCLPSWSPHV